MNKIYDKLLLLIGVLALAGGAALYFLQVGKKPQPGAVSTAISSEKPYDVVPVPKSVADEVVWPTPAPQSSEWVYDVFTPPKIYLDENGQFTAEGWTPPPPLSAFGIYLSEIVRKPYRIQIQGYIEEDRSDSMKSMLLLFDEERAKPVRIRPGSEDETAEIVVVDFVVDRQINAEEGKVEVTATATVLDKRTNKEVVLVDGERLYEDETTVRFRSDDDSGFLAELTSSGESFEGPSGIYKLMEINLDAGTVTVEKGATEDADAITQTLSVQQTSPATEATVPSSSPNFFPNSEFPI